MLAAGALALLLSGVFALLPPGEPETIVLDNGSLSIHVVDPDSGYYRGSRFESAGFILKLICSGHNWFGRNYEKKRNPEWHDHVCGNAEDFKFPVMDPETYKEERGLRRADGVDLGQIWTETGLLKSRGN